MLSKRLGTERTQVAERAGGVAHGVPHDRQLRSCCAPRARQADGDPKKQPRERRQLENNWENIGGRKGGGSLRPGRRHAACARSEPPDGADPSPPLSPGACAAPCATVTLIYSFSRLHEVF